MSNEFYNESGAPSTSSQGASATIRSEFVAIAAGFAKLPTMAGNPSLPVFVNSGATGMEAVSASSARTKLGLVIGTDVQAYDADLAAIAALTSAADTLPYATGAGSWALTSFTAAARSILGASTTDAMLTAMGGAALAGSSSQAFATAALTATTITASDKIIVRKNSTGAYVATGRTTNDSFFGTAAAVNDLLTGSAAGDTVVLANTAGAKLILSGPSTAKAVIDSTSVAVTGTGSTSGTFTAGLGTATTAVVNVGAVANAINGGSAVRFLNSNSATNWQVSANLIGAGALDFTPSTAGGGSTFTTPVLSLTTSGAAVTGTASATQYTSTSSSAALPAFGVSSGNGIYNSAANTVGVSANSTNVANFSTSAIAAVGVPINEATGTNIASASTVNLTTATGNLVHITGTTTITAVTLGSGMRRTVIFDGALTLTHHATNNNLPGGINITTAAGDRATYYSDGTTVYCISYVTANGQPANTFVSTGTAVPTADVIASVTHGLGATPSVWSVSIKCTSADLGYSVDDEITLSGMNDGDGGRNTTTWANATTIGYICGATGGALAIRTKNGVGSGSITPAKWTLTFRARK